MSLKGLANYIMICRSIYSFCFNESFFLRLPSIRFTVAIDTPNFLAIALVLIPGLAFDYVIKVSLLLSIDYLRHKNLA